MFYRFADVPRPSSRDYDSNFSSRNIEQENKPSAILRSSRDYDSNFPSRNIEQENKSSAILRQVSAISEESNELTPTLYRSNYASDFRSADDGNTSKLTLERNMKGFVDGCVRSSIHEVSHGNRQPDSKINSNLNISFYMCIYK
jgi:DNA-binding FrmR family transcriptional regulator